MNSCSLNRDLEHIIEKLVTRFYLNADLTRHVNRDREDMLSVAREAALVAVSRFKATRNTKLTTYVYHCVNNRLRDLHKVASHRPSLLLLTRSQTQDGDEYLENKVAPPTDNTADVERKLFLMQVLGDDELVYCELLADGHSIREIALITKSDVKEVKKCFSQIVLKLKRAENLDVVTSKKQNEPSNDGMRLLLKG